jgi:hypothetical protein
LLVDELLPEKAEKAVRLYLLERNLGAHFNVPCHFPLVSRSRTCSSNKLFVRIAWGDKASNNHGAVVELMLEGELLPE